MDYQTSRGRLWVCVIVCLLAVGFVGPAWGDVVSFSTTASNVTFDFDEDLVEPPSPWAGTQLAGDDSLLLIMTNFRAQSTAGVPPIQSVDGAFVLSITAQNGNCINTVSLYEDGDFDLFTTTGGTAATQVNLEAVVDGLALVGGKWVTLPSTKMKFTKTYGGPYTDDGNFNLVDDGGMAQKWYGKATLDVAAALAALKKTGCVEQLILTIDNKLLAASESTTHAFVAKKHAIIEVVIPEPSSAVLLLIGCCVCLMSRRRRS